MYFQGFLIPVKTANKQAYLDLASKAAPIFGDYGATRVVECWGDAVMDGKVTDMKRAVLAEPDENVVFSWIMWPDRAACDAAQDKIMHDDRMTPDGPMPFDGRRMIFAGFDTVFETGGDGPVGYIDGIIAAVPDGDYAAFVAHGERMAGYFREQGALRIVDGWGVAVPAGEVTDFQRAVQAGDGETVIFGWVEWPDKATRDAGMGALMQNDAMRAEKPAWNGALAIFGGFAPILDTAHP